MSKLWFRHGAVSASKTLQLLAVAHNYEVLQKKKVICIRPKLNTRNQSIHMKAGLQRIADIVLDPSDNDVFLYIAKENPKPVCVLVDDVQYFTNAQIDGLADVVDNLGIPVICYGLKSDFKGEISFEGSKRLLEIADKIEEIKTVCFYCDKKALFNLRLHYGTPFFINERMSAEDINEDSHGIEYKPVCRKCFKGAQGNRVWREDWITPNNEEAKEVLHEGKYF
jgi:thymidine kinase